MSNEPNVVISAFLPEACANSCALLLHDSTLIGDCFRCANVPNELLHYRVVSFNRRGVGQLVAYKNSFWLVATPVWGVSQFSSSS
jgi:hypothetical protein